jgi:hypothetical protein
MASEPVNAEGRLGHVVAKVEPGEVAEPVVDHGVDLA